MGSRPRAPSFDDELRALMDAELEDPFDRYEESVRERRDARPA